MIPILRMEISLEHDVVQARQRARQIAGLLGFDIQDQTRIATAVSEIARNAFQYAGGGRVEFLAEHGVPPSLRIRVHDTGPGISGLDAILVGDPRGASGSGVGIVGVRRLMDAFRIESNSALGTTVELGKNLPKHAILPTSERLAQIADELGRRDPQNPLDELRHQNEEVLRALDELRQRQTELAQANIQLKDRERALTRVNRELEDTNRGVVALYAELDEKADFLRRASEMKSRFLSNMSHEFRTPLNAITGLTWLLLDRTDGELTPEQEKQVKLIRHAAEGLAEVVNDLLDLAKVEAGRVTILPSEFHVQTLFGALRGMLRPLLAHNSGVALVFEDCDQLPPLYTDESKVSQILRNFTSNALKFTHLGEVRVSAAVRPDDMIAFTVADTGIGIAAEDQARVFEEFTQVEGPHQKRVKGTGLGLPLVKKLAGLLGGHVELDSGIGSGSAFTAVLPRVFNATPEEAALPEVGSKIDPKRRPVLAVEDNSETLFIYEKYLSGSGFQIIPARTVGAARRALAQFRPAAIILDVLLEAESTWELLAELKRGESTRDIPVLVMTLVENEGKAKSLGADAFCVKPVDRGWLLENLARPPGQPARERALVIEDDEASRYLMRGLLSAMNYEVIEADQGSEGLLLALREHPQLVALDLELPDTSGLEVMRRLRAEDSTRDIPVIINTSRVLSDADRREMITAGATAVLSKESLSGADGHKLMREVLHGVRARMGTGA